MLKEKREVIKHSSAIQIENTISLLQRKTWDVLFANAYDELPTHEEHTVNIQELTEVLEFKSKNDRYLKESLKGLMQIIVEWNLLNKDGENQWGATAMLASAEIRSGVCTYGYSAPLRRRLHNPAMYARISLELQNKFTSKHALALFELFQDYFDQSRQFGETPFIDIPTFRQLMGVGDKYPTFKQLNERIIKKSIKEIQGVTAYMIEVEYKQAGRQVVAVKFKVAFIPKINIDQKQIEMFDTTQRLPSLVAELVKGGVHRSKAFKIWSQGWKGVKAKDRPRNMEFAEYVHEKIKLLEIEFAKGNIDDKGAWLVAAIRDNYYYPTAKKRQSEQRIRAQIDQLQHEHKSIKQQQAIRELEIFEPLLTDENLEKAFEKLKQSASFPSDWHNYAHNIKKGMEQSQTFTVGLQLQIKAEHIEKFVELDTYQQASQKVESQILRLKAKL